MDTFIDYISRLIYASGGEAVITPNHQQWVSSHPTPTGSEWLAHHVDTMLPAFEVWLADHSLPPIIPWNGVRPAPWDPAQDVPLGAELDGSFTGIGSLDDLGETLRDRYTQVSLNAEELPGVTKAPFSYRYWGYVKWAKQVRDRYNGEIILPTGTVYDYDGTILSAIPFSDVFNELHWRWHNADGATPVASGPTPGLGTSAGQRARRGGVGMGSGEEFLRFHREHTELFSRWLARSGQPAVRSLNLFNGGSGWPAGGAGNPSTWIEADDDPWINTETGDADNNLRTGTTDPNDLGSDISFIHGSGHGANSDITDIFHNNYVPRFFAWHGWIDNQLWWREPRFARWDLASGLRERVFEAVLASGDPWPGLPALTIVRDPAASGDEVAPANAISGLDLTTGAGTLRMKFLVRESYDRPVTARFRAEVFDDASSTTTPVETIPEATHTYTVGDTASGDDLDLGAEFMVDFVFGGAFQSDDPAGSNPAVGFVNSRIRITGTLEVASGMDPGFVHIDHFDLHLVQEKQAPAIELYFDLSTFGEDQVDSAMSGGEARFGGALIVSVQDRTSMPATISWPAEVADEVKGLVTGPVAASGLFDDAAHAPEVLIWQELADAPITGLTAELASGPELEDVSRPDNLPQRFIYRYDVVFSAGHLAFDGLAMGASRVARVRVRTADRSGNSATALGQIKLLREANPYMRDDDPSWLSIDTRVFRLFEGETKFNATLNAGQPNTFIQQIIQNLNAGTTGGEIFDDLPENQAESALEYSTAISNPSTGGSQNVYNFALAKVRLQGAGGAADVRAFFRLFRYTASNPIFEPTSSYRTHDDGMGRKVPLLGFSSASGGDVISIPFFASPRLGYTDDMRDQTDTPNVQSFAPGPTDERVLYFGAYLDINQDNARLPANYIAAHPDGGFGIGEVQPIRSLMTDAHQCMVVEINYDGDPTDTGETPASSDNLAQRNLMILTTDNPGAPLTHTVQHSFEVDTGKRLPDVQVERPIRFLAAEVPELLLQPRTNGNGQRRSKGALAPAPSQPLRFISSEQRRRLVWGKASSLAMIHARNMEEMMDPRPFLDEAAELVDQRFPFVFDNARWRSSSRTLDELMIRWNGLPSEAEVEIYLPRINSEQVVNLRNLRHAPGDVRLLDEHTLRLQPGGVTFLPLPPVRGGRIAGVITVALPEGIRKGQAWQVDVLQLRGGEQRVTGGFQLDIQVSSAAEIADAERRLLAAMFERLALTPHHHRWHPVLARRVETIRARAQALAEAAGIAWEDPTVWTDLADPATPHPLAGRRIRVVLEQMQILDDRDPWLKGKGEFRFRARVTSANNGGLDETTLLPTQGHLHVSDRPGENIIALEQEIFRGYVADDLRIEVTGVELDTFDPDDLVGKYTRLFCGNVERWLGAYGPGDETIDPEEMLSWRLWYRIEYV